MHRIDTPTAQKDKFGAGKNGFTRGNPQTGTPATDLDDDYFDMLQEELAGVVEATGVGLDKSKHNQLLTALKALLLSREHPFADIKADGAAAVAEALSNLGLKGAAKCDVGATAGTVAAGDDSRFGLMLGVGQTWQDLSASRALSVTYTNSTGKPIMVFASTTVNATSPTSTLSVNNIPTSIAAGSNWPTNFIMRGALVAIVPSGGTYRVDGGFSLSQWTELR